MHGESKNELEQLFDDNQTYKYVNFGNSKEDFAKTEEEFGKMSFIRKLKIIEGWKTQRRINSIESNVLLIYRRE